MTMGYCALAPFSEERPIMHDNVGGPASPPHIHAVAYVIPPR